MEGTALHRRLTWQLGKVVETRAETARARSLTVAMPEWPGHRPGQHVDVRLTAEGGYQTERSYSIASPPEDTPKVTITVERLDDGEVSPYLVDEVQVGDHLELRGPIGGYFVWKAQMGGPLLLVGGGSGVVPLMAMLRHRRAAGSTVPTRLLYSSRSQEEVIYRDELNDLTRRNGGPKVIYTLTRQQPPGWSGYHRRIDEDLLRDVAWPARDLARAYICGPTLLVETAATILVTLGYDSARIKTERFGPTGGG
jgi:ferredoxin-NADP reductase